MDLSLAEVRHDDVDLAVEAEVFEVQENRRNVFKRGRKHQSAYAWAMNQLYNAPPHVPLAPLRWNLVKISRSYEERVKVTEAEQVAAEAKLKDKHAKQAARLAEGISKGLEKAKEGITLTGQLRKIKASVDNLERVGRPEAAAEARKKLPPLETKFWEERLGGREGFLFAARRRERGLLDKQGLEAARVRGRVRSKVQDVKRELDVRLKAQLRANEKSSDNPFHAHWCARFGDMVRLGKIVGAQFQPQLSPTATSAS